MPSGELLALKSPDINLKAGVVTISKSVSETKKDYRSKSPNRERLASSEYHRDASRTARAQRAVRRVELPGSDQPNDPAGKLWDESTEGIIRALGNRPSRKASAKLV